MKILYLIHDYTSLGGVERIIATKVNYFIERGYDVYIVSTKKENPEPFFYYSDKTHIISLDFNKENEKNIDLYTKKISSILNDIRPDVTISTNLKFSVHLHKIKDGSKKILEHHMSKYKSKPKMAEYSKYWWGKIIADIYKYKTVRRVKKFDRFIVLTEEDREQWGDLPNIEVIPNPLSYPPSSYTNYAAKRIILIGRYTNAKGFDQAISIWSKVSKKYPDWKLVFFGNGRKKSKLEKLIQKFDLSSSVELNGPTNCVEKELTESSIYMMTSRYEGLPLVLMEGMACGLPAIAFACKCGPRDIITDGEDGFLINVADDDTFAEKLSLLIDSENLRRTMGEKAKVNILRYSESLIMPKWEKLFESFIGDR